MSSDHQQPQPQPQSQPQPQPGHFPANPNGLRVAIAGAGLGGLMLGILLECIGIDYIILERSAKVTTLGSAIAIGPHVLPVFEQLGMYEDIMKISLVCPRMLLYDHNIKLMGEVLAKDPKKLTGYESYLFSRPDFCDLLVARIPAHKLLMEKQVSRIWNSDLANKVTTVECKDGSTYDAHIVVGADGTYSRVRGEMYDVLKQKKKLPKVDTEPLGIGYFCMVGVTQSMDPEMYPVLNDDFCHFSNVMGGARHSWSVYSLSNHRFSWSLSIQFANEAEADLHRRRKHDEWNNTAASEVAIEMMMNEFRRFASPYGGTMGELMDATPSDVSSKVFLEYKMFETWYHGRTVLIGDACHKMLPSAGQGGINAMQDAVIMANCLYDLQDRSLPSITKAFESYYKQRYEPAKSNYKDSQLISKVMLGQSWTDRIMRSLTLNYLPHAFQQRHYAKSVAYRPQIMFLPQIKNKGVIRAKYQKPCMREPLPSVPWENIDERKDMLAQDGQPQGAHHHHHHHHNSHCHHQQQQQFQQKHHQRQQPPNVDSETETESQDTQEDFHKDVGEKRVVETIGFLDRPSHVAVS